MTVTVKVNGTSNSLVHKGSMGISMATVPDVCKTPSPGGPIPLPYPNISQSSSLDKGTTTVKADGGMMIAIKGSEFSLSNGDEPGTIGGVKSSTFMKESTWILYSFDVKMEGQNVCRLSDKKFQNHENTADAAGVLQVPVIPAGLTNEQMVACAIHCCDVAPYDKANPKKKKYDNATNCRRLSITKHSCVMHALRRSPDAAGKVDASPRAMVGKKLCIPDTMFGKTIIDAKFPCQSPIQMPVKGPYPSAAKAGSKMLTEKEKGLYKNFKVKPGEKKNKVSAMTPSDAATKKGSACDCKKSTPK